MNVVTHEAIDQSQLEAELLADLERGPTQLDRLISVNTSHPEGVWSAVAWNLAHAGQIVIYTLNGQARRERIYACLPKNFPPPPLVLHVLVTSPTVAKNLEYSLTSYAQQSEARDAAENAPPDPRQQAAAEASAAAARERLHQKEMAIVSQVLQSWGGKPLGELRHALVQRQPLKPTASELREYWRRENFNLLRRRRDHLAAEYRRYFSGREASEELLNTHAPMTDDLVHSGLTEEELFGEAAL